MPVSKNKRKSKKSTRRKNQRKKFQPLSKRMVEVILRQARKLRELKRLSKK